MLGIIFWLEEDGMVNCLYIWVHLYKKKSILEARWAITSKQKSRNPTVCPPLWLCKSLIQKRKIMAAPKFRLWPGHVLNSFFRILGTFGHPVEFISIKFTVDYYCLQVRISIVVDGALTNEWTFLVTHLYRPSNHRYVFMPIWYI